MKYNLNLGCWNKVFAVPQMLVEKYINYANLVQLKVLLWVLGNKEIDSEKAARDLNLTSKEFEESLIYWKNLGFFSMQNQELIKPLEKKSLNSAAMLKFQRPDASYIASRMNESSEIKYLVNEFEIIVGRPKSSSDIAVLIMLHDSEGLPIDVILMLVRHCIEAGKNSMRYIYKVGVNWAQMGIDSIEKAEIKIEYLNRANAIWKNFQKLIGIEYRSPTQLEESIVVQWYEGWNFKDELIKYAYEICVDAKGKYIIKYMDSILRKWYNQGILSVDEAKESQKLFRCKARGEIFKTYDLEAYEKYDMFADN